MAETTETTTAEQTQTTEQSPKVSAKSAEFQEAAAAPDTGSNSIDMILNMTVPITVAIGKTQMSIQRLLQLGPGSVVQLEKPVSEPMELYLNGSKFATGEVVVIEDQFAIRIVNIIDDKTQTDGEDNE